MAGLGRKVFTAGDVLTASDVQNYMMDQSVMYFAGTAARSSAIATPTTGMVSYIGVTGTASIPQIETYTGSAWQTPYGSTLIANATVSAAATTSINNVFSSAYENYMIVFDNMSQSVGGAGISLRMRTSGTDSITGYNNRGIKNDSTLVLYNNIAATSALISVSQTQVSGQVINMHNPAKASYTTFETAYAENGATFVGWWLNGMHGVATAYDGITFFVSSGTFSGTIRIYGLRNS